ncbi:protein containing Trigger factor, ribosome-binding, bacterial domain [sediment metagenome]|uniref:Protein containing Trigger factor, ribosome-binding, bacterial domain n=1 Tax=sediment metagenome TaxID=749907 RepID=D9PL29_9ZZZZ
MTATVETLDGLNRRLTLNLNQAEIEAEVSKRLAQVARTVRMDGFRPAKRRRIWLLRVIPVKFVMKYLAMRCNSNSARPSRPTTCP